MKDIFNILARDVAQEIKNRVQASAKDVAMLLAATLLLVCGFMVLMFAAYVFLLHVMAPVYAALVIAGLFVAVAMILLMAIKTRAAHNQPDEDETAKPKTGGLDNLNQLEGMARDYVRGNAKQASFMSLLAGVVVGSSPDVRRTLMNALDMALAARQAPKRKRDDDESRQ